MKLLTLITFSLLTCVCFGQNFLILKSKSVLEYKEIKFKNFSDKVKITFPNDKESEIEGRDIEGDLTKSGKSFKRPIYNDTSEYGWAQRVEEGKINVYERIDYVGMPGYGSSKSVSLFLEKDLIFVKVYSNDLLYSNKSRIENVKALVKDSQKASEIASSSNYRNKYEDIIRVIRTYNLEKFDPNYNPYSLVPITGTKTATLTFYSNKKIEKNTYFTVNGEGHYNFIGYGPASVPVPVLKPSKVCLTNSSGQYCEIMTSGLEAFSYYEVTPKEELLNSEYRQQVFAQKQIAYNFQKSKN